MYLDVIFWAPYLSFLLVYWLASVVLEILNVHPTYNSFKTLINFFWRDDGLLNSRLKDRYTYTVDSVLKLQTVNCFVVFLQ